MPELARLVLRTHKLGELVGFYSAIGFDFEEEQPGKGPLHYAAAAGDATLELYPLPEGAAVDASTRLGFRVEDVVVTVQAVRDIGGRVESKPNSGPSGLRAVVRDPDGRAVELTQD